MNTTLNVGFYLLVIILSTICNTLVIAEPRSGYEFIKPETRLLQDDDFENPGLLTVEEGNELFNELLPGADYRCADCHQSDGKGFVVNNIASYPKVDKRTKNITTLQDRVIACAKKSGDEGLSLNDKKTIALETFVRYLAKGEKVSVETSGLDTLLAKGEKLYSTRYGLIDISCQHCHVLYPGTMLRGQHISEGMANGFPAYRLATGEVTTVQQRIQQCLDLMRAEPFETGSDELRLMELYMMVRSNGLTIEVPAVRY